MQQLVELTDKGLFCALGGFYIDPWRPVETAVITHAHGDHARIGSQTYHSHLSGEWVLRKRLGEMTLIGHDYGEVFRLGAVDVSLHPAGHVLGSSQVRIEYQGLVWVVTGDYKRDPDKTCLPFQVVPCDAFISEATFSLPIYQWPDFEDEVKKILAWWEECREANKNAVLCCYAFGKAQRLLMSLVPQAIGPIYVHGSIDELNKSYRASGVDVGDVLRLQDEKPKGALVLCPPSAVGSSWVKKLMPCEVGFASGWMRVRGRRRQAGYDRGFVISDHADWPSLLRTVKETGAKKVFFMHGDTETIVRYLREQGVDAHALAGHRPALPENEESNA